jgi:hypothetical protein
MAISVYNVQGEIVFQSKETISSGDYKTTIDLGNAAKGVYIVKINTGNDFAVKQLIVR